jgi:hypothetical protein
MLLTYNCKAQVVINPTIIQSRPRRSLEKVHISQKGIGCNEHERQSNITLRHKLK